MFACFLFQVTFHTRFSIRRPHYPLSLVSTQFYGQNLLLATDTPYLPGFWTANGTSIASGGPRWQGSMIESYSFLVSYVEEKPCWPIQRPNKARKNDSLRWSIHETDFLSQSRRCLHALFLYLLLVYLLSSSNIIKNACKFCKVGLN